MQKLTLATLSTLAFTLASTSIFALDGTITVNGAVTDQTCTLQSENNIGVSGLKDITVTMPTMPKSWLNPPRSLVSVIRFALKLSNAEGTGPCDAATTQAFKGVHLSAISPDHLDTADKTLLVNQASGASTKNPIFMRIHVRDSNLSPVDFLAPWGDQAQGIIGSGGIITYQIQTFTKTGIVDAQNYTAKINYTLHYN